MIERNRKKRQILRRCRYVYKAIKFLTTINPPHSIFAHHNTEGNHGCWACSKEERLNIYRYQ